ncbi:hypothetical protein EW146_g9151 [Bondarzewia mesenterica]|uniref:Uncharacterized protein n=1 Tax=Bondarzewia mesenterica TaxID=1095465 RepID=A0A4S4LA74_9AGAM|nr:hypothetical protein EW146_g9151 [Bondarzewia mesenterica]
MPYAPPPSITLFTHKMKDEGIMDVRVKDKGKKMGEELGLSEGPMDLDSKADANGEANPSEDSTLMDKGGVIGAP